MRRILGLSLVLISAVFVCSASAQVGKRYPSEKKTVKDSVTGAEMIVLTNGAQSDSKIYQTHPQWSADGKWIIFRSSGRAAGSQAYAVNESTGEIVQLTEGAGNSTGTLNIARKSMKLYYLRDAKAHAAGLPKELPSSAPSTAPTSRPTIPPLLQIIELDLDKLFADSATDSVKPASAYERICAAVPEGMRDAGGFGLDADEQFAYMGVSGGDTGTHLPEGVKIQPKPEGARMGAGPGGLRSFNLQTGEMKVIIDTPFQMGHVQTNPWKAGEIIYCHETGGDGVQRMWTVMADGSGNRPLFEEGPLDWVTHETVVTKDEVMFNLIGHQSRLRVRPTGIAVINLRTNAMTIIGQIEERNSNPDLPKENQSGDDSYGGFWHCQGSEDGKWAVGDTFLGNVWLISRADGKRTLLSTDHKMKPDHCHPNFDATGSKILIQSGHWTDGTRLQLVVIPLPKSQ